MEQWPSPSILPSQADFERHPNYHRPLRVLGDASGNVQTYAQDFKAGIENQNSTRRLSDLKTQVLDSGQSRFPAVATLPSNDHAQNIARLHARRPRRDHKYGNRRRPDEDRPYLRCHKYTEYRARRRQDTGDDGKPVWDDPMEDAFQNALVAIKPMGRKKKSQNGKPNGRNELIAEWIFHETGQQRTRKQVSSHIQVLNQLLKGIPEWDLLVAVPPDDDKNSSSMAYFGNSIERAVNSRRLFRPHVHGDLDHQYATSVYGAPENHQILRLSFEMWVSLPGKMEEALHNYTRLQCSCSTEEPTLLEDINDWRLMYPRLDEIISGWALSERCDVIMLDASFRLMSDFPPKGSKLGISLELDFLDPSNSNCKALEDLQSWEGSTTIYDRGRRVHGPAWYNNCHSTSIGKVKPFFESKYWANIFTRLTERRRRAEEEENEAAIALANQLSRSDLRHLTVIQEIYARAAANTPEARKRMAILLWRFSQAQPDWAVGITTWKRLIPPTQQMTLPSLAEDSVMNLSSNRMNFGSNDDFLEHFDLHQTYMPIAQHFDEELCQDGTMMAKHSPDTAIQLAAMQASFTIDSMQGVAEQNPHNNQHYHFDLSLHDSQYLFQGADQATSGNIFETQPNDLEFGRSEQEEQYHNLNDHQQGSPNRPDQPLNRFDVNTHNMLQVQLDQVHTGGSENTNLDEEELRQALVAASAMSNLGNHPNHPGIVENGQHHSWTAPPISPARPQLQNRASFAGQINNGQCQHYGAVQEIPPNVAGFNANGFAASLSAGYAHHATPANSQPEDQYQSTGSTRTMGSFRLEDCLPPDHSGSNVGGSFVGMNEMPGVMEGCLVAVRRDDRHEQPEHQGVI